MITIRHHTKSGPSGDYTPEELVANLVEICNEHQQDQRVLFFTFMLYDFRHPHIIELLKSQSYWNGLDTISGQTISVFAFHSPSDNHTDFREDRLPSFDDSRQKLLNEYFDLESNVTMPALLFFQVDSDKVINSCLIQVKSESVEQSFNEIDSVLSKAVESVAEVVCEEEPTPQAIFNLVTTQFEESRRIVVAKGTAKAAVRIAELVALVIGFFT